MRLPLNFLESTFKIFGLSLACAYSSEISGLVITRSVAELSFSIIVSCALSNIADSLSVSSLSKTAAERAGPCSAGETNEVPSEYSCPSP